MKNFNMHLEEENVASIERLCTVTHHSQNLNSLFSNSYASTTDMEDLQKYESQLKEIKHFQTLKIKEFFEGKENYIFRDFLRSKDSSKYLIDMRIRNLKDYNNHLKGCGLHLKSKGMGGLLRLYGNQALYVKLDHNKDFKPETKEIIKLEDKIAALRLKLENKVLAKKTKLDEGQGQKSPRYTVSLSANNKFFLFKPRDNETHEKAIKISVDKISADEHTLNSMIEKYGTNKAPKR